MLSSNRIRVQLIAARREQASLNDASPLLSNALKMEIQRLEKLHADAVAEESREQQRILEEKALHSPIGRAIMAVFDDIDYDYWDQSSWPHLIQVVENELDKHGMKVVPK